MPNNSAALLTSPFGNLEVRDTAFPTAGPGQLVIRNRAIAVNPLDVIKQSTGNMSYRWLPYPSVLGEDIAGDVVAVAADVSRFHLGDRVIAYAIGMEKGRKHQEEGGFQHYTLVEAALTASIPDTMAFEDAAVLPLAVSTAASALFQADNLGLRHPTAPRSEHREQWVVIWGGSTSVGSNAIQLAAAAGYRVATTASPHNHNRLRALGAELVFDYANADAVSDIIEALKSHTVAGVLAVGTGSAEPSVSIATGTGAKRVSLTSPSVSLQGLPRRDGFSIERVTTIARLIRRTSALMIRARIRGIQAKFVWGSSLHKNDVGPMLWEEFLPQALANGTYTPAPRAEIVGAGLEDVQAALDTLSSGVSARKLVIRIGA